MKKNSDKRIKLIGIGNEFRGDDAVGVKIAQKIKEKNLSGVDVIFQSGEGMALIESWKNSHFTIIVDASYSNSKAGKVFRFDATAKNLPESFFSYTTHAFSVAEAVKLARVLRRLPQKLIIYAVEGKNFQIGVGISNEVERKIEEACQSIIVEIQSNLEINAEKLQKK